MNFLEAIASGFRNYINFSGRARRSEYWYWVLFVLLLGVVTALLDAVIFGESELSPINLIAGIVTFLPGLAIGFRRLHDIDRTGWWWLIVFTIIGVFVLIYWACLKGTDGSNRYGPDPFS
ncbi:MAG: DUF805 domain-containing protein [Rhizobiales bacterium]|nr:DUF805 domain-containing protein [Hyphomicrobiales bacterium]